MSPTEIKTPIRIPATGLLDPEESTKPGKSDIAGMEKELCCACPKTEEEKNRVKDDRVSLKIFENFLHNTIFLPRYGQLVATLILSRPALPFHSAWGSSLKEAKPCMMSVTGRQPLCESDRDPSVRRSQPAGPPPPSFYFQGAHEETR